ncbi:DUF4269 domain-containing protein [Sphingobium sp. H39-3-25]|uniref:DUF4269 domain-containing protein n=1 Tax=Sphingobium arseniciresistens TaxID=3030834 RepID=UPI0023B96E52|nr:DUF4269 domain-containing protein [Sphingobium arseniciresistens]
MTRAVEQRPDYQDALARLDILETLARFDPHIAGTPPLGIAMPSSDIDILCHAPDAAAFADVLWSAFSGHQGFAMRQWAGGERAVIATFVAEGWAFELFGSPLPVARQAGWRHFLVEQRLLALGGPPFRAAVLALRHQGIKTEPAFGQLLSLPGDPYAALLALERESDESLAATLSAAGFHSASSWR